MMSFKQIHGANLKVRSNMLCEGSKELLCEVVIVSMGLGLGLVGRGTRQLGLDMVLQNHGEVHHHRLFNIEDVCYLTGGDNLCVNKENE